LADAEAIYWDLNERAECGELVASEPGQALTGAAAACAGAQDLMWATDTATVEEATTVALKGRPRLSPGRGRSPVVHARLSDEDHRRLEELSDSTGRPQSDLIREGIKLVLAASGSSW
jgi:hypothetical protein